MLLIRFLTGIIGGEGRQPVCAWSSIDHGHGGLRGECLGRVLALLSLSTVEILSTHLSVLGNPLFAGFPRYQSSPHGTCHDSRGRDQNGGG